MDASKIKEETSETSPVAPLSFSIGNGSSSSTGSNVGDTVMEEPENSYWSNRIEEFEERPMRKKPKLEEVGVFEDLGFVEPPGFFDPLSPPIHAVPLSVVMPALEPEPVARAVRESSVYKQFWNAGDCYDDGNRIESSSCSGGGMDRLRVHPRFLHSNATSHKWALGAFAELLDNALDEVCNGATYVHIDMLTNNKDGSKMLLVQDNGGGMTPNKMRQCMSLGYSSKSKMENVIGHYGNGFKTSTMRLSADVIVFSSCKGDDGRATRSIGILSYTFLMSTKQEDIIVPMVDYEKRGDNWEPLIKSSTTDWIRNLKIIAQWSPYSCEQDLLQQFNFMEGEGTRIIIYNLWEDEKGNAELDFDTDPHDIQIRGVIRDENKIQIAKQYPNSSHFLTYKHSLRSYSAILYLRLPAGFRIILRGKEVIHHCIENDMMISEKIIYRPKDLYTYKDGVSQKVTAALKIGFVKDAHHHIDIQGFNIYHKNRLINPFRRVWNAAGSGGRGIIGVIEANFVKPAHDKQGFEHSVAHTRLIERLRDLQKKYWGEHKHEIGYVARQKHAPDTELRSVPKDKSSSRKGSVMLKSCKNSDYRSQHRDTANGDKSPPEAAYTQLETEHGVEADHTSEASNSKAAPNDGHGCTTSNNDADERSKLLEENRLLRKRLMERVGSTSPVIHLYSELCSHRNERKSLENKLREAEESVEKIKREQEATINLISQERVEREEMVETLSKELRDASETINKLLERTKELTGQVSVKVERD